MKIDDIDISRSLVCPGSWIFNLEMSGCKFTGQFDNWGGFLTMIQECAMFFAVRWGKMEKEQANKYLSRHIQ